MPAVAAASRREDLTRVDDRELVDMARSGGESAFREIMRRYNRRLYRSVRAVTRDPSEAEDALQEAYLKAFAHLGTFRGDASLPTWLTRIALNEALGRVRRRKTTEALSEIDPAQGADVLTFPTNAHVQDPEAAASRAQIRRVLEQAVEELPDAFRLVFVLRAIEEMSIEETAAHLDLRPETVKTRLHRARRLLRKSLDDKFASALSDVFPFEGARCARLADGVMARMSALAGTSSGSRTWDGLLPGLPQQQEKRNGKPQP